MLITPKLWLQILLSTAAITFIGCDDADFQGFTGSQNRAPDSGPGGPGTPGSGDQIPGGGGEFGPGNLGEGGFEEPGDDGFDTGGDTGTGEIIGGGDGSGPGGGGPGGGGDITVVDENGSQHVIAREYALTVQVKFIDSQLRRGSTIRVRTNTNGVTSTWRELQIKRRGNYAMGGICNRSADTTIDLEFKGGRKITNFMNTSDRLMSQRRKTGRSLEIGVEESLCGNPGGFLCKDPWDDAAFTISCENVDVSVHGLVDRYAAHPGTGPLK